MLIYSMNEKRNTKQLKIIRNLLENPNGTLTKYRLSKLSDCTPSRVMQVIKKLEQKKIVTNTKVIDFDKLIDYYIEIDKIKQQKQYFHIPNPSEIFKKENKEYAFTTYFAENLINHYLFPNKYQVYVKKEDASKWKEILMKKGLMGKGNTIVILTEDKNIFKEATTIKEYKVVSTIQLLIDLKKEGGVCIEAYNMLLSKHVRQKRN
jgi:hypothetical protein